MQAVKLSKDLIQVSHSQQVEPGLEGENLHWVMMERLKGTCLPSPSRFVLLVMCLFTSMENRNFYGGLELVEEITGYSERTVRDHVALLHETHLLERKILQKYLYLNNMRQNYHIYLPPKDLLTCADWQGHNQTESHLKEFPKIVNRMLEHSVSSDDSVDGPAEGSFARELTYAIGMNGDVISNPDFEPLAQIQWLF
jgi:hypothetical protein